MELLYEGIALGVDLLLLGLCMKEYVNYKKYVNCLKKTPELKIDSTLKDYVLCQKLDNKVPYVAVRGTVTPIGVAMRSVLSPSVTGVVQRIKLNEHRVARGFAGFWTSQQKLIHTSVNTMPFELRNNENGIEIMDPLSAAVLDLDVVYDNYEPASLAFFDHVFGFFSGVRQKGIQTTEEVLRDGSFLTAIGELDVQGDSLRLQPSSMGPLFLTTATKSTLIKKLDDAKKASFGKILIFGTISIGLIIYIGRKIYLRKKQERDERKIKESIKNARLQRLRTQGLDNLTPQERCVVCTLNPKEIILLPCGHVCICENCSEHIKVTCPVCRQNISSKAAAFIC